MIDVWGVGVATVTAGVGIAHVIGEDDQEVWLGFCGLEGCEKFSSIHGLRCLEDKIIV